MKRKSDYVNRVELLVVLGDKSNIIFTNLECRQKLRLNRNG